MNKENEIKLENAMSTLGLEKSIKLRCACCGKEPKDIKEVVWEAEAERVTPEEFAKTDGTYSRIANMFVCTDCYIKAGSPSINTSNIKSMYDYELNKLKIIKSVRRI